MTSSIDQILRSAAFDILCRRYGTSGWKPHRAGLLASMRKTPEALALDAERALHGIVTHAYATVAYYRAAWDALGFRPTDSFSREHLRELPFLTKDAIRKQKQSLVSRNYRVADLHASMTGGTTGTQTTFYLDHACWTTRVGRQWGVLELCGYQPGMRRGMVWGVHEDLPDKRGRSSPKRWFADYARSEETLCCTIISDPLLSEYHARLRRFRPQVLYGYPSALCQLAAFIREQRLDAVRVRTIITTAERLTAVQRDLLTSVFGGEVFNLYCTREHGCIGFECREHQGFHIDTGSVVVEICRDGQPVAPGESGEITITDLQNRGMPFIRSPIGDIGSLSNEPCRCGLPHPVLQELDGRSTDVVYRADGSVVQGLILTDLFADLASIRFAQFVQESEMALDVLLVVTEEFSPDVEQEVVRQVTSLMGKGILINLRRVPEIPRNPRSGKYQEVICRIARPAAADGRTVEWTAQ